MREPKGHKITYIKQGIYVGESLYKCECGERWVMRGIKRARDFHYRIQLELKWKGTGK